MSGIMGAVSVLSEVVQQVNDKGVSGRAILDIANSKELALAKSDGSMIKLLGNYIVEPTIIISNDLRELDIMDGILGLHVDMFTGFYMQVFDILRSQYGLSDRVIVDKLATDNGGLTRALLGAAEIAVEDRDYFGELMNGEFVLSNEAVRGRDDLTDEEKKKYDEKIEEYDHSTSVIDARKRAAIAKHKQDTDSNDRRRNFELRDRKQTATAISKNSKDLFIPNAVQRMIEVSVTQVITDPSTGKATKEGGEVTYIIPITIKANVLYTDTESIINVMEPNADDKSFFNRLDEYRAGAITLADFVFASDIIDKYKNNKLKDKTKLLELIQSRVLSANSKAIDNGLPGFEKYYNMYIVSADEAVKINKHVKGKITNDKYKQKFLDQSFGLSATVVDLDYERIKIMLRDLRGSTDVTFKTAVKADKKGGSDTGEIVKALMNNRPPVL